MLNKVAASGVAQAPITSEECRTAWSSASCKSVYIDRTRSELVTSKFVIEEPSPLKVLAVSPVQLRFVVCRTLEDGLK